MDNFIYLIEDSASKCAAVVDPAWDVQKVFAVAEQRELTISDILLTHSHHDHVNGVEQVLEHSDGRLHLLAAEASFWGKHLTKPILHHGGDRILLGDSEIEVLHTPGHTPGSACYLTDGQLLTGDTMFVFGCGRCDLNGGDAELMFDTLRRLRRELPGDTVVHPGHNYAVQTRATMSEQCEGNPFMHFEQRDDFVNFRMQIHGQVRHSPYDAISRDQAEQMLHGEPLT